LEENKIMPPEIIHTSEVRTEWEETISGAIEPLAERYGLEYQPWYHNAPIWFMGEVQLTLIRDEGISWVEIYKGDRNHLSLQIEKVGQEALQSVVECLLVATD
jgi:hypothetical protein